MFRGRTPALSFMRPFGCHVTILNTLYYLGKFDGKSDKGFFVGYSMNSKAFRWLFDIDVLTKSMNYVPVVTGTNSNDLIGTEESIGASHSSKEIGSRQDYILMPLWKNGLLFESSSKNASDDEPQPSSDAGKKDDEGVNKESGIDDQEIPKNSTQDVNTAGPSFTAARLEATHVDFFGDETEVDMSNITTTYQVPSTPNTRIHKDHSLYHVISDVQFTVTQEGDSSFDRSKLNRSNVYRNKKDKRGFIVRNKARPVAQGYTQEEGIDYDDVFAPVARIEAIRLLLAYALFMNFVVYKMDVKSVFLYGKIEEEVYVCQPSRLEYLEFLDRDYKVEKALYGLHQAPRACYDTLSTYLLENRFQRGTIDKTLFIKKVMQKEDRIFISQDKYVDEILKKFSFLTMRIASTPMETSKPLLKDAEAEDVDVYLYRSMIGSLIQEHAAQAQTQPIPPPPPIPSPTPTPIPTSTSPPPIIPSPTPPPIPTPTSPPPPPPETEPPTDEHIYEEQSPVHHHFSPSQAQAPSHMPTDDLLQTDSQVDSR
ncbi:putative ribonuclease H-like domain-containing protein [Tanacetum coccineum]